MVSVLPNALHVVMENTVVAQELEIAHLVRRARLPTLLVKLVLILARIVIQENTPQQAREYVCPVVMENGQAHLQPLIVRHAMPVRETPIHLVGAQLKRTASATPA